MKAKNKNTSEKNKESLYGNSVRWVLSHAFDNWPALLLAVIGAFGNAVLASVVPVYIGKAYTIFLNDNFQLATLYPIILILCISQVIRGLSQFLRNFGFEWIAQKVEKNVRHEFFSNLLSKNMAFHNTISLGDIMARATNDVRQVNFLFSPGLNVVIGSINFLFVPLFLAPTYHYSLIFTPLFYIIFYAVFLRDYIKKLKPITDDVRGSFGNYNTYLIETLEGIEVIKTNAKEKDIIKKFLEYIEKYTAAFIAQGDLEAKFIPLLLLNITLATGLIHSIILVNQGYIDTGSLISYFGLLSMLGFPTFASRFAYSRIANGFAGARRILDLLKDERHLKIYTNLTIKKIKGKVEFKNVSFGYNSDQYAIRNINLTIKPEQTIALVGQTGSGKTTLAKLINRTFDCSEGSIFIDDCLINQWDVTILRKHIAWVEQDVFLFSRSIKDNIALSQDDVSMRRIIHAAKKAQAHEFITNLENGYDTVIGERGVTLSGGQRQRLAIARALISNPRILILDDSTSSIDSKTEDLIQKMLFSASKGRTTILITHRLSQIRWADIVVLLRNGEIIAKGSHDELMNTFEEYRKLFLVVQ